MVDNIDNKENFQLDEKCGQLVASDNIESLIKVVRGKQVMLDKDLATLYGVETKVLNQTVKRNIERFPDDFRFELSREECLRSQIATLNGRGGNRYSTYAFTEQGVAMLSSVLRSKTAIKVNTLDYLCDLFDIPEGKHHCAGDDAEMCAKLFLREIEDAGWCELEEMSYCSGKL